MPVHASARRLNCARPGLAARRAGAAVLLLVCLGCGLGDSAYVECRCTPLTSTSLFPGCPTLDSVSVGGKEHWVTLDGDTLDPAVQRFTVRNGAAHAEGVERGSPLSTQVPDCPSGAQQVLRQRTSPEAVLLNVRDVFAARPGSRNVNQYMDQLTSDYTFVPDAEDIEAHPEVYDAAADTLWARQQERSFAAAIFDTRRIGEVSFSRWYVRDEDERIVSEDQFTETFRFPYEATFTEVNASGEQVALLEVRGWMEVDLVTSSLENPVWAIQQWRDQRDPASAKRSWGELRAEFAR